MPFRKRFQQKGFQTLWKSFWCRIKKTDKRFGFTYCGCSGGREGLSEPSNQRHSPGEQNQRWALTARSAAVGTQHRATADNEHHPAQGRGNPGGLNSCLLVSAAHICRIHFSLLPWCSCCEQQWQFEMTFVPFLWLLALLSFARAWVGNIYLPTPPCTFLWDHCTKRKWWIKQLKINVSI